MEEWEMDKYSEFYNEYLESVPGGMNKESVRKDANIYARINLKRVQNLKKISGKDSECQ